MGSVLDDIRLLSKLKFFNVELSHYFFHTHVETESKGMPDILDFAEVRRRTQSSLVDFVPPTHAGTLCFWGEESTYDHVEIDYGQGVRLKTKGDSPFLGNWNN